MQGRERKRDDEHGKRRHGGLRLRSERPELRLRVERYGQHLFQLRHDLPVRHGRPLPALRMHHDRHQLIGWIEA